ncbi:MAG: glycosyltransferase family 2 protein [Prevotellaceae bacterium]|jgi:hypothetical protein|nr:glycosyltransferase family 2 protein [Prevotellaceae bacterium]
MKKILICIPHYDHNIDPRVIEAVKDNVYSLDKDKYQCDIFKIGNYSCHHSRNIAAQKCVKENYDWLLFVDSDTILPTNFLRKVIFESEAKNIKIISGWYFSKDIKNLTTHCLPINVDFKEENKIKIFDVQNETPMEVAAAAMGCCLIDSEVFFTNMQSEPFQTQIGNSSDIYFFLKYAKEIKKYVIPSLKCGHIAKIIL